MEHVRSILFVCLGNICRSPLAEGAFRAVAEAAPGPRFHIDSAGTSDWNIGEPPDPRAIAVASRAGIDISGQRARQISHADFDRFDLILGMDARNVDRLNGLRSGGKATVALFLDYAAGRAQSVPDPYDGGRQAFEEVLATVLDGARRLHQRLV